MTANKSNKNVLRIFFSYAPADHSYAHRVQRILSQRPNVRIFTSDKILEQYEEVAALNLTS